MPVAGCQLPDACCRLPDASAVSSKWALGKYELLRLVKYVFY
jgi:hypothetical protein